MKHRITEGKVQMEKKNAVAVSVHHGHLHYVVRKGIKEETQRETKYHGASEGRSNGLTSL